ncbi:MAG: ATP-binding protein [Saprospiraceae bacterium]
MPNKPHHTMRYFNTSGPNIASEHYTLVRTGLIDKGRQLVAQSRYFTIWAPRQTGKSTYFRQLAAQLGKEGYSVAHVNFENFRTATEATFLYEFTKLLTDFWGIDLTGETEISRLFSKIKEIQDRRLVLIVDEVEGVNPAYFGTFLHSIRNAYHSRETHSLKSVILVGVTNILGVVQDNASPFNIADNLDVPYFTDEEVRELFAQHETETGQLFDPEVTARISRLTANQPGLVNGFANQLVTRQPDKPILDVDDFAQVEDWYLTEAIDKNFENILKIAKQERRFVERLLFTDELIPFTIDRPATKLLHTNGLLKKDKDGYVAFWVPFYRIRLHNAFYPYTNGETRDISRTIYRPEYVTPEGALRLDYFMAGYKAYAKRRGFGAYREKDEHGKFKSIPESALVYSFETYIQAVVTELGGRTYREAHTGLGRSDLIIHVGDHDYVVETKVYYSPGRFEKGRRQLAYYCRSLGLDTGTYVVFCPTEVPRPPVVSEGMEHIEGVDIHTYIVDYDEKGWEV